jgi:hypothetical protein
MSFIHRRLISSSGVIGWSGVGTTGRAGVPVNG